MAKSEKYKGVYQRDNGTWWYRFKRVDTYGKVIYPQESGFETEEDAEKAKRLQLQNLYDINPMTGFEDDPINPVSFDMTFGELFNEFIELGIIQGDTTIGKYKSLYNAHLTDWEDKEIYCIEDADIDLLLLKLSLKKRIVKGKVERGYSKGYISSVRQLVTRLFKFARWVGYSGHYKAGAISREKYKLRVLSLFSGIGAPEQALRNLGIDYELVNFCEIDEKASKAYCLLHNVDPEKNLKDIRHVSYETFTPEIDRIMELVYNGSAEDYKVHNKSIPNFDIMIFGFPCQDISSAGKQRGLAGKRSKLFFNAMCIAYKKKPKFLIAENVKALVQKDKKRDFDRLIEEFEDCGYISHYYTVLNSKDYGVPQSRNRTFFVMVRDDLNIDFKWPEPIPLTIKAEEWFKADVAKECYCSPKQLQALKECENFRPNFNRDIISTITTGWGTPASTRQTFVVDEKGTRCLDSEELMRFQGFPPEYGTLLRKNGFSKNQVGKLVGNSITVNVIQAILEQLLDSL